MPIPSIHYLAFRALFLRPFSIGIDCLCIAYGIYWVYKPRVKPVSDLQRLLVLALVVSMALGLILFGLVFRNPL